MHCILSLLMVLAVLVPPAWPGCTGDGIVGMSATRDQSFPVPWKLIMPEDPPLSEGLAVYWLPSSQAEIESSSLRSSRILATYSQQCVTMGIVDYRTPLGRKMLGSDKVPIAVLAKPGGTILAKVESESGELEVELVEKLLNTEMKKREDTIEEKMNSGKIKVKAGDISGAVIDYRAVWDQRCMFPGTARIAAQELKKLGVIVTLVPHEHQAQSVMARLSTGIGRLNAKSKPDYPSADSLGYEGSW